MRKTIAAILVVSVFATACSKGSDQTKAVPALAAYAYEASKICYSAEMKVIGKSGHPLTAGQYLGPITYFMTVGETSKKNGPPKLDDYQDFMAESDFAKYKAIVSRDDYLPQCFKRFPLAQEQSPAKLPSDQLERDTVCLYISRWTTSLLKGVDIKDEKLEAKSKAIQDRILDDFMALGAMAKKYGVTDTASNDRLMEKIISESTKYGNINAIMSACQ